MNTYETDDYLDRKSAEVLPMPLLRQAVQRWAE
jgi:hypothetical protein